MEVVLLSGLYGEHMVLDIGPWSFLEIAVRACTHRSDIELGK